MTVEQTLKMLLQIPEDQRADTLLTVQCGESGARRVVIGAKKKINRTTGQQEFRIIARTLPRGRPAPRSEVVDTPGHPPTVTGRRSRFRGGVRALLGRFEVQPGTGGEWWVTNGENRETYEVNERAGTCSCPDYARRGEEGLRCKHVVYLRLHRDRQRRAAAQFLAIFGGGQ